MKGEVFRLEKVHKPWVPRSVGVEAPAVLMEDTESTFGNEGTDRFPLVRGNMGEITTPAVLEGGLEREVEYTNGAGLSRVMAVVTVLKQSKH